MQTIIAWLHDPKPEIRLATCQGLSMRLRNAPATPSAVWLWGALAERYRIEPNVPIRRALIAQLAECGDAVACVETLVLAADLDADRKVRQLASQALAKLARSRG